MEHKGRNAIVTGAVGGLGVAQVESLARAGAAVTMVDVKPDGAAVLHDIAARLPADVPAPRYEIIDLADSDALKARVAGLDAEVGGYDIVVNNAAINPSDPIDGYDLDLYRKTQAINATAAVAIAMATVPSMKRKGWGQIVNICSITMNGGWTDFTAYVTSKGALHMFTRSLARELGAFNIRVNAVSPGAIPTPMEEEVWADQLETYRKFLLDHQALKYRGRPEDIAEAVLFLISDRARFITGQNISVDGGWWMH
ncbi:MAG: SDR family NAD(P)-dependent oxidoreductase [Alphaproteobacteria bacterium]